MPIVVNAKMRRTGVCGATECLLVDKNARDDFLTPLVKALLDAGCEVRGDAAAQKVDPRVKAAAPDDYGKEFLDAIIAVKIVDGVDGAIDHIARYGSQHTDAIITEDEATAERFLDRVDSRHRAASTPRPSSPTAANSASAARSASRPARCMRAALSASSS